MNLDIRQPAATWPVRLFFASRRIGYRAATVQRRLAAALFRQLFGRVYRGIEFFAGEDFAAEHAPRWAQVEVDPIALTIVVVTYRQPLALDCLLASLRCQTLQNFEVLVIHDGEDAETRAVVERFSASSSRYRYLETAVRYNDWGHSLREIGIGEATGSHLLITNGDNYYSPRFLEFVFEAIERLQLDIALWDMVHSYHRPGRISLRCYQAFRVYPVRWMVDIGAFVVRTELARRAGFPDKTHNGDATYLEALLALPGEPLRVGKIEKTLTVHN
jgi:glycosyltransferase involved in cell wall biosynthesis